MTDLYRALFVWAATCLVAWLIAGGVIALVWP
jgi:hypothetical protein